MAKSILSVAFQGLFIKRAMLLPPQSNAPIKPVHPVGIEDHLKSFGGFFPNLIEPIKA